ncbi:hypothetical protein BST81_07255 [Leptolyngbya sp. 'hensonii']|uniref:hypothetical protein n=1 Tax=Leptolyngbya sp. 'hensonii' TaxID=1922337 RepID=UPI00094FDF06|nr:hypothetical protein [Leptolyngbya sp. 'hensonii']OLP19014.1 hypothetical protein BST81_07255 [Leptolyngbya sp. 'hensonii']
MNPLRSRVHRLVDRLSEEDLENIWMALKGLYYDSYMLKAIQDAKATLTPGDSLTREEALRSLLLP